MANRTACPAKGDDPGPGDQLPLAKVIWFTKDRLNPEAPATSHLSTPGLRSIQTRSEPASPPVAIRFFLSRLLSRYAAVRRAKTVPAMSLLSRCLLCPTPRLGSRSAENAGYSAASSRSSIAQNLNQNNPDCRHRRHLSRGVWAALGSFDFWLEWLLEPSSANIQLTLAFWIAGRSRHYEMATELAATNLTAVDVKFWISLGRLVRAV